MIDNFKKIEDNLLDFEPGCFYIFQCLVRNTDGDNSLYEEGYSNKNKNILIKSWFVDSPEYYEKIKNQMKTLCELTDARLYMNLDKKSTLKTFTTLLTKLTDLNINLIRGQLPSIKNLQKLIVSSASMVESSQRGSKRILFDVDTKDKNLLRALEEVLQENYFIMNSKKGYHIVAVPFDTSHFYDKLKDKLREMNQDTTIVEEVSFNKNELGLVYVGEQSG